MNHLHRFTLTAGALLLGFAAVCAPVPRRAPAAPAATPTAAQAIKAHPADCAACHKGKQVLPAGHTPTQGMTYKDCQGCHTDAQGQPGSLRTHLPGSHLHALNGVRCAQCHENAKRPQAAAAWTCTGCHEPKALAAATASVQPRNPHESRHFGVHSDCNKCHHQHRASENECGKCHEFKFQVP